MSTPTPSRARRSGCPICGKPAQPGNAPFCGARCRDRDLLQWLGEGYRVAGPPADPLNQEIDSDGLDSDGGRPL